MNRSPLEPLTPEERALAAQLARLGPHGEPSPSLDARILAAAHDAVAAQASPRGKPRWPVAIGLAATVLLAVGIAWQLRPVDDAPIASEMPAAASVDEEAATAQQVSTPPSGAGTAGPPVAAPAEIAPADRSAPVAAIAPPATPEAPPVAPVSRPAARKAIPTVQAPLRGAAPATAETAESRPRDPVHAPAPPPAPTVSAAATAAPEKYEDRAGFVAPPETTAAIAAERERARAQQARDAAASLDTVRSTAEASLRARKAAEAGRLTTGNAAAAGVLSAPAPAAPTGPVRTSLKRTDLQLPVAEDAKLGPDDWLERIRLRRDLGDRASATDSLLRFKQSHPFQKVPDDLQELLGE